MNLEELIKLTSLLLALSSLIQSLEYLSLKNIFSQRGIFRSPIIENDLLGIYSYINREQVFLCILYWRLICSLLLFFSSSPYILASLLLTQLLLAIRFRGTFNGGSDYMTILTMIALLIASISPNNKLFAIPLMYLAVQTILSYFFAGVAKLRDDDWRSGTAIAKIINGPNFSPPHFFKRLLQDKLVAFLLCWIVMGFEVTVPLIGFFPDYLIYALSGLLIFHLINFFIFGLNRFVFAWLATYPAVFYLLTNLPSTK